jgi:hypothetical protein
VCERERERARARESESERERKRERERWISFGLASEIEAADLGWYFWRDTVRNEVV